MKISRSLVFSWFKVKRIFTTEIETQFVSRVKNGIKVFLDCAKFKHLFGAKTKNQISDENKDDDAHVEMLMEFSLCFRCSWTGTRKSGSEPDALRLIDRRRLRNAVKMIHTQMKYFRWSSNEGQWIWLSLKITHENPCTNTLTASGLSLSDMSLPKTCREGKKSKLISTSFAVC